MRTHAYDGCQGSKWVIQIQRAGPSVGVDRL